MLRCLSIRQFILPCDCHVTLIHMKSSVKLDKDDSETFIKRAQKADKLASEIESQDKVSCFNGTLFGISVCVCATFLLVPSWH